MEAENTTQKKIVLVNIRGNITPMTEKEVEELREDTDWLVDTFKD